MTTDETARRASEKEHVSTRRGPRSGRTSALKWQAAGAGLGILLAAFGLVAAGDVPDPATEPALSTPAITRTTSASTTLRQSSPQARVRVRTRQS
jgi:hypothetical protein